MKVCLLNDSFPPVIDGVVNVMQNYAKYLMKDYGAEVTVGCPRYPDTDYSIYPYHVVPYPSFDTTAMASGYRTGNPLDVKAVSELAAFAPDIIHSHCPASATVIARLLREDTEAPLVFTYHTKYDIDIRRAVKLESIAREGIRLMVSNIEACDEVWTVSRGAGESLKALGFSGEYRVMDNGVDFARGRADEAAVREAVAGYDLPEGVPVLLFVGRLMTYKGLPLIMDALKIVSDAGQDFRMVFVGKGPDRELLEEKAAALGLTKRCIFTGPVYDRDILRAWNTRADLFLFPSTFDTNGLVVREAAACGLASVLIRDSCAAEGITDGRNGFLIEENADSMAAMLLKLCPDLSRAHEAGIHAMEEIYLSWETCVARAYDRYQVILDDKKSGRLQEKRRGALDYLVSATAKGMRGQDRLRRLDLIGKAERALQTIENQWEGQLDNMRESSRTYMQEQKEKLEKAREAGEARSEAAKVKMNSLLERLEDQVEKLEDKVDDWLE